MQRGHNAIALLITVMFVIVITVAIGFGLKQVNDASKIVQDETLMYQNNIIVEDVLNILATSPDIARVVESNSSLEFNMFIASAGFIPLSVPGLEVVIKIESARGKFNPNTLDRNRSILLKQYFQNYNINSQYVDMLVDNMSKIKEDNSYNTAIFDEEVYLFRDYIASSKHLAKINDFYTKEYNDNSLQNIDFNNLFYYSKDKNVSIDLNYATKEVWEMILGVTKERAEYLTSGAGTYTALEDLDLGDDELFNLRKFKTSFFEPIIAVEIEIRQNESSSKINFEYDIKAKKGSNFVYEI